MIDLGRRGGWFVGAVFGSSALFFCQSTLLRFSAAVGESNAHIMTYHVK